MSDIDDLRAEVARQRQEDREAAERRQQQIMDAVGEKRLTASSIAQTMSRGFAASTAERERQAAEDVDGEAA